MSRWKLLEYSLVNSEAPKAKDIGNQYNDDYEGSDSGQDEWAWIYSLLQQNERWKDIYKVRSAAEQWRIGTLKMFNGCWGFISQTPEDASELSSADPTYTTLDIFFHRKDICPEGAYYEDWWLQDTPGVSRSQKCGYWDTFLYGRKVRYKQRAAYAQGRRPQACQISFLEQQTMPQDSLKQREFLTDVSLNPNLMIGNPAANFGQGPHVLHNSNLISGMGNVHLGQHQTQNMMIGRGMMNNNRMINEAMNNNYLGNKMTRPGAGMTNNYAMKGRGHTSSVQYSSPIGDGIYGVSMKHNRGGYSSGYNATHGSSAQSSPNHTAYSSFARRK